MASVPWLYGDMAAVMSGTVFHLRDRFVDYSGLDGPNKMMMCS